MWKGKNVQINEGNSEDGIKLNIPYDECGSKWITKITKRDRSTRSM